MVEDKVRPARLHEGMVDRGPLVRLLTADAGPQVVSVIAPPGYGKTTLLAQVAAREERPVAWLTLDDLDNDPGVLLRYLATALDRIAPIGESIGPVVVAPRERILATAVPRLTSALHAWSRPAVLVLDDAHRVVDRTCLDALAAMLLHLPTGFRVIVAGRSEPDLPFARLRVQRNLLEIDMRLLALDEREAAALAAGAGFELTPEQARALVARTEGWAAGVYLTMLGRMRDDDDPDSPVRASGADRLVAAYLRSEVERGLDDDDIAVLTRTSILETVSPPVAEAISAIPGAGERIRAIAEVNLLLQEVGREGSSFHYHNLLGDFLRAELERREPGTTPELHRRAMAHFEGAGDVDRAIGHAFDSGDEDATARLVTAYTLRTFRSGRSATLETWLARFDGGAFERHPPLAVAAAMIHLLTGRADEALRLAEVADRATFDGPPGDGSASFGSQRAILRALMCRRGPRAMLEDAELALSEEGPGSPWRGTVTWLVGTAHRLMGDEAAAITWFEDIAAAQVPARGAMANSLAQRASIAMRQGDWALADAHARRSLELMVEDRYDDIVGALSSYAVGARVAIHGGDRARGQELLVQAQLLRSLATHAAPWLAVDALLELTRAYMTVGDLAGAQATLRDAEHIARRRPDLGTLSADLVEIRQRLSSAATVLAGSSTLTGAELRLLPLLPTYLSFEEIGARLTISRHTVKTQAMSIYGKLQASSRGEAVERAIELGLLEPFHGLRLSAPGRPERRQ